MDTWFRDRYQISSCCRDVSSSSNELHSSSVVSSVVNERGIKVFDGVVGSATKEHFGVFDPVFKVEFGDLFIDFLVDVRAWNSAFDCSVAILTFLRK